MSFARSPAWDRALGALLCAVMAMVMAREWGLPGLPGPAIPLAVLACIGVLTIQVPMRLRAFVAVGAALGAILAATDPGAGATAVRALETAGFIAAFFCALATLRTVAQASPGMQRAGAFLAGQSPGRRYLALTLGGQMFALLLNYGAIQLLGTLAVANARAERDPEIAALRTKRMLLAIQRGFISSLPWSPMGFGMAITTTMVPGGSWAQAVAPGLVTAVLMAGIGWALDAAVKPRAGLQIPPRTVPAGGWRAMWPLAVLLTVLGAAVSGLFALTGIRVPGLVLVIVPAMALLWLAAQRAAEAWQAAPGMANDPAGREPPGSSPAGPGLGARLAQYAFVELPAYRGELTLLMMAGIIGTLGAPLLVPVKAMLGIDLAALPAWVILAGFVWIIPLAGQVGMNPILAVTLLAPLIPAPETMGVSPTALVVAITAGWALSGACSPFTATTILIGGFARTSALRVGLVWNGVYTAITAVALSVWVVVFGVLLPAI